MMGTLYLIATPIGNLEDISARALRLLAEVEAVAAEDTRTARRLLTHFGIKAKLTSYNEHNRKARIPQLLAMLETADVALISEAGTPAISDPGQELVAEAIGRGIPVVAVPGASAVLAALTVSGLSTRQFVYLGFLPRQPGERRSVLRGIAGEPRTVVCFEAPSRLNSSLRDMLSCLGNRRAALCRELTKLHEETARGTISELLGRDVEPRGEYTVVIDGAAPPQRAELTEAVLQRLAELREQGRTAREATAQMSTEFGLSRRQVYEAWLKLNSPDRG
jgi:16S rRNA (cytidine1402-2'-O)-methyltransferase